MKKRMLCLLLVCCMIFTLLPTAVFAVSNPSSFTVNVDTATTTVIKYSEKDWYVIGYNGTGVASQTGTLTLLSKKLCGFSKFNPSTASGNAYANSTLQTAVNNIANGFSEKEKAAIAKRTLTGGSANNAQGGMCGADVTDALLWPLDGAEANSVNQDLRKSTEDWWLRSPGFGSTCAASVRPGNRVNSLGDGVDIGEGIRPAFQLNLSSVIFASAAAGGKTGTDGGVDNFTQITDMALSLRFSDASVLSDTNASVSASGSAIKYTAPADSVLVAEMTVEGKAYQARKNIDSAAANATLDLATLTGLGDGVSVTGKVWIEKMEDTANNKGLIYAIAPVDVTYAIAPAHTPVTNITGVPTTGTALTSLTLAGIVAPANATNKDIAWSIGNAGTTGAIITGNTLTASCAGIVAVTATITNGATINSDYTQQFNITINRKTYTGDAISAPTLASKTDNEVVLNAVTVTGQAVEYAKSATSTAPTNESDWQDSTTFEGLTGGTVYYFFARVKKTNDTEAGGVSAALSVTTKTAGSTVELPTIGTGNDRPTNLSITITTKTGQEYYISESATAPSDWSTAIQGNGNMHKFTNLTERTKYYIHVRVAETPTAMPSTPDKVAQYTLPATPDASVVTINYAAETISYASQYEVFTKNDGTGTEVTGTITPGSEAQTIYVRVKAVEGGAPASEWQAVTIPSRPAIGTTLAVDYSAEKVTVPAGYSYQISSGAAIDVTGSSKAVTLDASTTLTYWKTATSSSFRSEKAAVTAPARLPHSAVAISFINETINTTTAMEYSTDGGITWTSCTENMSMSSCIKSTEQSLRIREKATANHYASEVQTLTIAARATAPNAGKTDETIFGKNDGTLTSVTTDMEYKPASATTWAAITSTAISNLAPGTYQVRRKATDTAVYSNSKELTIAAGQKITLTFDSKGGSSAGSSIDLVYHQTVTPPETLRTGHTFMGWWTNSDGTGAELTASTQVESSVTYYAKWTANSYTVTFKANGGTGVDTVQTFTYDEGAKALNSNTFTRTNYTFSGWNTAATGTGTSYTNAQSVQNLLTGSGANLDLYAQWAEAKRHNLSGEVKDDATPAAVVTGATVTLKQGATVIATTKTDGEGKYSFTNLSSGTYNLVVTKNGKTTTLIYVVAKAESTQNYTQNVTLPTATTNNSALVVEKENGITEEVPKIVVGGLDEVAASQNADITMTVTQKKEDKENATQASIKVAANGQSIGMYLDVELKKGSAPLTDSGNVLELIFPYSFAGKTDVKVWREHGGSIEKFVELNTKPAGSFVDKTFYSDKENGLIYVYASKFSTYAVSYTQVTSSSGSSSHGGGSSHGGSSPSSQANPQTGVKFEDVTENDWFYNSVMNAVAKGWFTGTSETTFSPYLPTTRGMIATVLHRMENQPAATAASIFEDVATGSWYNKGITWAQEKGIVKGYSNVTFGPQDNITREQMAAILYRYAVFKGISVTKTITLDSFTDGNQTSQYAIEPMKWAVANGLISGRGNGILDPKAGATRAEVTAILTRFAELLTVK